MVVMAVVVSVLVVAMGVAVFLMLVVGLVITVFRAAVVIVADAVTVSGLWLSWLLL